MRRIWDYNLMLLGLKITGVYYQSPSNFNYNWNFGFMSFLFLISQLVTGILLAMFYSASSELAFGSVFDVVSEVYYGWFLRYLHANGASFFFFMVYFHMFKNLYYCSFLYPRQWLWYSGAFIWLFMIATAFLGYILPWGQMSYWGAMVITSLFAAIPYIGGDLLYLLWGGFSIESATLHRFYSLHYMLPFLILFLSLLHFFLLHEHGSNNPLGVLNNLDSVPFFPYYGLKDLFSFFVLIIFITKVLFYNVDYFGHSDNFLLANALVTPAHIVPEWYFLPLYAVLRAVTNKLLGIFLIACFILCIFLMPIFCKTYLIRSTLFRPLYRFFVWCFFANFLLLFWVGSLPVIDPFILIGQSLTFFYFFIVVICFPFVGLFERFIYRVYICYYLRKDTNLVTLNENPCKIFEFTFLKSDSPHDSWFPINYFFEVYTGFDKLYKLLPRKNPRLVVKLKTSKK